MNPRNDDHLTATGNTMDKATAAAWLARMDDRIADALDASDDTHEDTCGRVWAGIGWLQKASAMGWPDHELCSHRLMVEMAVGTVIMVTPDVILLQRPCGRQVRILRGKPYGPPQPRSRRRPAAPGPGSEAA
jgi:hypothetical protein